MRKVPAYGKSEIIQVNHMSPLKAGFSPAARQKSEQLEPQGDWHKGANSSVPQFGELRVPPANSQQEDGHLNPTAARN